MASRLRSTGFEDGHLHDRLDWLADISAVVPEDCDTLRDVGLELVFWSDSKESFDGFDILNLGFYPTKGPLTILAGLSLNFRGVHAWYFTVVWLQTLLTQPGTRNIFPISQM